MVMAVLGGRGEGRWGISLHFMLQCLRAAESIDNYRNPQCLLALWLLSEFLAGLIVTGQAHGSELGEACFLKPSYLNPQEPRRLSQS